MVRFVPDLVNFSKVKRVLVDVFVFWGVPQGVDRRILETFQGFAGVSCLSILTVTVIFLLCLGCDMVSVFLPGQL